MQIGKKGIYVMESLVISYIVTGIFLCVLAFVMYQMKSGTKIAGIGVTVTYILASMIAGWITGRKIGKRKFLWGLAAGLLYFLILFLVSMAIHSEGTMVSAEKLTVLLLCAAGGTLGGMLG